MIDVGQMSIVRVHYMDGSKGYEIHEVVGSYTNKPNVYTSKWTRSTFPMDIFMEKEVDKEVVKRLSEGDPQRSAAQS